MAREDLTRAIVAAIGENSLCLRDIAGLVGRSPKDGSVRNALRRLVAEGVLERAGDEYGPVQVAVAPACTDDGATCTGVAPCTDDDVSVDDRDDAGLADGALPDGVPDPPESLGDAGRDAWIQAFAVRWTHAPDVAGVAHLARLEDEAQELVVTIARDGVVAKRPIVTPKGEVVGAEWVAHPLIAELRKLDRQLVELRATLGLDPASRARLGLNAIENRPDAIDELQERRRQRLAAQRAAYAAEVRS